MEIFMPLMAKVHMIIELGAQNHSELTHHTNDITHYIIMVLGTYRSEGESGGTALWSKVSH